MNDNKLLPHEITLNEQEKALKKQKNEELENDSKKWAQILLESIYTSEKKASVRHEVSIDDLRKKKMEMSTNEDSRLYYWFNHFRTKYDSRWVEDCNVTLNKSLGFLNEALENAGSVQMGNPAFVDSVVNAVKVVAEVRMTSILLEKTMTRVNPGSISIEEDGGLKPGTTTEEYQEFKEQIVM